MARICSRISSITFPTSRAVSAAVLEENRGVSGHAGTERDRDD